MVGAEAVDGRFRVVRGDLGDGVRNAGRDRTRIVETVYANEEREREEREEGREEEGRGKREEG